MKLNKLLVNAAAACLLAGASGVAMAASCASGFIVDRTVDSIEINGQSCFIIGVRVRGDVIVENSPSLSMVEIDVGGRIRVQNTDFVAIVNTRVTGGSLKVTESGLVAVKDNDVKAGSININTNVGAVVSRNDSERNINCLNNGELDSRFNHAKGDDNCKGLF